MDRVAIFIDGNNFYHALKDRFGTARIDFQRLQDKLCGQDRRLLRTYYYNAAKQQQDDPGGEQLKFFDALERTPYFELRKWRLERRPTGLDKLDPQKRRQAEEALEVELPNYIMVEKGVDVRLAVDMVEMARKNVYDVAILISGDGDFTPAVAAVKEIGKYVELAHVEAQPCRELRAACDVERILDAGFLSDCWLPGVTAVS